jgi:hypothetical protein
VSRLGTSQNILECCKYGLLPAYPLADPSFGNLRVWLSRSNYLGRGRPIGGARGGDGGKAKNAEITLGPAGPQALLMQIAASKLQYLGTEQGLFFDPESREAEPLVDNEGFREALILTRRLWMASLDSEPGGWTYLHHEAWLDGRCACYLWLTGSVAQVTRARPVARVNDP